MGVSYEILAKLHPVFNYIWDRIHSDREDMPLRTKPGWHMNTGGWPSHLQVQSLTSEWALTHSTNGALERKDNEKVGCPVRPQPSQAGWNFCRHQLFTRPSQITLMGRMDEVYFCIVLHKDEDRGHFLLCVLQSVNNHCSMTRGGGQKGFKHTNSFPSADARKCQHLVEDLSVTFILCIQTPLMCCRCYQEGDPTKATKASENWPW